MSKALTNFVSAPIIIARRAECTGIGGHMLKLKDLDTDEWYFVAKPSVVLKGDKQGKQKINHLLLGDWLEYLGETYLHKWTDKKGKNHSRRFVKVHCRNDDGWLALDEITSERALEVNFVDIGQGDGCHIVTPDDEILVIDAGVSDNMHRFLSWRYNLRYRNVRRAPDFDSQKKEKDPWKIDHVVMSHPDEDHYGGFTPVFKDPKLSFESVYHNGIVERPGKVDQKPGVKYPYDLGGFFKSGKTDYLFDLVASDRSLTKIVDAFPKTTKRLLSAFRALKKNSPNSNVISIGRHKAELSTKEYLPGFDSSQKFSLEILGPIIEREPYNGRKRNTLRRLGSEGVTKNGHSIILKGRYGNLTLLLGGDLNSQSQNFLLSTYAKSSSSPEKLLKAIKRLKAKAQPLSASDQKKLDGYVSEYDAIEKIGRQVFEADIAKACHHGSQHIIDSFIRSVNATATVISSGDQETHSHPRPDALGAYGKFGRGERPLIFSTELARSTREFSSTHKNYLKLRAITLQIEAETNSSKKKRLIDKLESMRERNVAVYGMITVRALGDLVIVAQKLEEPRSASQKWDIYELEFDASTGKFNYHAH